MGLISSVAMSNFKDAYFEHHGRYPHLQENHGWIRIDGSPKSYRPTQLMKMADGLRMRSPGPYSDGFKNRIIAELAEPEKKAVRISKTYRIQMPGGKKVDTDVWDVSDQVKKTLNRDDLTIKPGTWKTHIKKNTIMLFLNRLCEKFNNSPFDMDKAMGHFIYTGELNDRWENETLEEMNEEILSLRKKLKAKEANMEHTIRQKNLYRDKVSIANQEIDTLKAFINQQERDMVELKKNSVVFSLDFMEDTPKAKAETWLSNEDDVPF